MSLRGNNNFMDEIKDIESESEYIKNLKRLEVIFYAAPGTPEGDELEYLITQVERYEKIHYSIN